MIRRGIASLLLAGSLVGCMGHDGLSHKVLKWNLTVAEGRWTREFLFVGMFVIPVYPLCKIADLLVLNSIEFWSGKNPINGRSPIVDVPRSEIDKLGLDGIEIARVERLSDERANLYVEFRNGDHVTFDVVRDRDGYTVSYGGVEFFKGKVGL